MTRQPNAVDVMFALRVAHRLGLPGATRAQIVQASEFLAQAQRVRRSVLEQALSLAESPLAAREFGQAVEALAQQATNRLAPFDERFACLLDHVSWPGTSAAADRPARRLASPWLAHGLMMAMATGCASSPSGAHDANPPIDQAPADTTRIVLLDVPFATRADTQPLPSMSCTPDGAQNASLDASCDVAPLEAAVSRVMNGACSAHVSSSNPNYAVVIDCDGRVVELLTLPDQTPMLSGTERQAWLDSLANDRWPCFAGQSVQIMCLVLLLP